MLSSRAFVCRVSSLAIATPAAILLTSALAPGQTRNNAVDPAAAPPAASSSSHTDWPTDMLLVGVEGQTSVVPMGTTWKNAVKWATKFYPHNNKLALKALKNTRSELGEADVKVEPFYMSRFAVTNEQYLRYVNATGNRFPFHWWKNGAKANFEAHRQKIFKAFPDLGPNNRINAPVFYWEDFWKARKLEYAIPKGQEKFPVVFVSWKDALKYSAWAGMRLPTEIEWTFAANGGKRVEFVFGDELNEQILQTLEMSTFKQTKLKAVGALGKLARGPFGHGDMVGQVWEWVLPLGFGPQTGRERFEKEYKLLRRKDKKLGKKLEESLNFRPEYALAKGGCYYTFSNQDFIQARINCRASLDGTQTMSGLGFRVAKSKRPAYDMSLSQIRATYPDCLSESKAPEFAGQAGWESYELEGAGDLIKSYHAVSLIPISYLSNKKAARAKKIGEASMRRPIELAVIITTEAMTTPELTPGTYVAYLRQAGIRQELKAALKAAHKALTAAKRAKERAEAAKKRNAKPKKKPKRKPKKRAAKDSKEKVDKWIDIVRHYGYTHEEIVDGDPKELAKFVYLRHTGVPTEGAKPDDLRFKVSTETNQLLFRSSTGKWLAAVPTKTGFDQRNSDGAPSTISTPVGGTVDFSFSVPTDQSQLDKKPRRRKVITFSLRLQMK